MTNKSGKTGSKSSNGAGTGLAIIGGIVAAAAAGAYFIHGNKAAQQKIKKVKSWALKAKGEVLEKMEKLKSVDEALYHQVIDAVMKKYTNVKNVDVSEIMAVAKELKSHWKNIKRELNTGKNVVKKTASAVAKTGAKAKKVVTKVAKKTGDAVAN